MEKKNFMIELSFIVCMVAMNLYFIVTEIHDDFSAGISRWVNHISLMYILVFVVEGICSFFSNSWVIIKLKHFTKDENLKMYVLISSLYEPLVWMTEPTPYFYHLLIRICLYTLCKYYLGYPIF